MRLQGQRGGRMRLVTVEVKLTDASSGETVGFERMTAIEQEALTP